MAIKRLKNSIRIPMLITIVVSIGLFVAVSFLMVSAQRQLYADVQSNLEEIVLQNREVIANRLNVEMNTLKNGAELIEERLQNRDLSDESFKKAITEFVDERNLTKKYYIANEAGKGYFPDGAIVEISSRDYFGIALTGIANISERILSKNDGTYIFVFCVPMFINNVVCGTLQRYFSVEEMYNLCEVSLFSSRGTMSIIDNEGYIMISNENSSYNLRRTNYYNGVLYAQGDKVASRKLEEDIREGRSGSIEVSLNHGKFYSSYTQIPEVHNWYLITSVSVDAVSKNSKNVILTFYIILSAVIIAFAIILFMFFRYQNKQKSNLERIAFYDQITKGNSYNKFVYEMKNIFHLEPYGSFGIVALDIENFKYINSFYGFDFGDKVLREMYNQISHKLGSDELIARISGDHFVLFLRERIIETESGKVVEDMAERVNQIIDIEIKDAETELYIKSGLYRISDINESPNLMIDKAGTASQSGKGLAHKRCAVYDSSYEDAINRNEQLKRKIDTAIRNKEFVAFYQPKVNILTGEIVGAEALARWITKGGSIISPAEFIQIAETTGQIVDIDMMIFEKVISFLATKIAKDIKCLPISVNFSRLNLNGDNFIHKIIDILKAYNVPSHLIQIELTESAVFENNEKIVDFVNHLHEHGLMICIDDFGSGYSSLNMLKDIPVDVLKIDKVFLNKSKNQDRQRLILSTIALMARNMDMEIVVEGVESAENVELMKDIGCNIAQGYFYAKPMPENQYEKIFVKGRVL